MTSVSATPRPDGSIRSAARFPRLGQLAIRERRRHAHQLIPGGDAAHKLALFGMTGTITRRPRLSSARVAASESSRSLSFLFGASGP